MAFSRNSIEFGEQMGLAKFGLNKIGMYKLTGKKSSHIDKKTKASHE